MPRTNHDPLEKDIEKRVCDYAKAQGCLVYKFTSPARRSVPDRMFIMSHGKGVFFIEFKRRGKKLSEAQTVEKAKIENQGITVWVVDNVEDGKHAVRHMLGPFLWPAGKHSTLTNLDEF